MASEMRTPIMMRAARSRPMASVPKKKCRRWTSADSVPRRLVARTARGGGWRTGRSARSSAGCAGRSARRRQTSTLIGAAVEHRLAVVEAGAGELALEAGQDGVGARIGLEARGHADELRIDPVVGMRPDQRAEDADQRQREQHDGAGDGGAVPAEADPGVLPERAAGDGQLGERFGLDDHGRPQSKRTRGSSQA